MVCQKIVHRSSACIESMAATLNTFCELIENNTHKNCMHVVQPTNFYEKDTKFVKKAYLRS